MSNNEQLSINISKKKEHAKLFETAFTFAALVSSDIVDCQSCINEKHKLPHAAKLNRTAEEQKLHTALDILRHFPAHNV